MTGIDPSVISAVQQGDYLRLATYLHVNYIDEKKHFSYQKTLPVCDIYLLLKSSVEGGIHPKVFEVIINGEDPEKEDALLKMTLRNSNFSIAWMILNCWKKIEKLDFSDCKLKSLPSIPSRHCETLRELDISGNEIEVLSLYPDRFPALRTVHFHGNPLSAYSEKCKQSWPKMKEYIQSLETRACSATYKKLFLVGDSGSGKTTILKSLMKNYKSNIDPSIIDTCNINTAEVTIPLDGNHEITLNVWDIKGQLSAVRNFFLTSRAVFVLCVNVSSPLWEENVCYWFQLIQSLCKASMSNPSSSNSYELITPVYIVTTGDDNKMQPGRLDNMEEPIRHLASKVVFRGYLGTYFVSRSGRGIKTLASDIVNLIKAEIGPNTGLSMNWILFKDCLDRKKKDKISYMDWNTFDSLSKKCNIKKSVQQSCTMFLRNIGTVLVYLSASSFWEYRSVIILDPEWMCKILLKIFNDQKNIINGLFTAADIPLILSEYPTAIQDFSINLLLQYNILHKVNTKQYLIPSLLSKPCPFSDLRKHWSSIVRTTELEHQRIFQFYFLPLEFFPRVIVRVLQVRGVVGLLFWKNGVLFQMASHNCLQKAILTYDENKYSLSIQMRISNEEAPPNTKYTSGMLFRHIIEVVETLLESYYPKLVEGTNRLVPCIHCMKRSPGMAPFMFTYFECIAAVTSGKSYLYCQHIPSPSRRVSLFKLAPDIAFAELQHLSDDKIVTGSLLGEGSFGVIHNATFEGNPVAIKCLKDAAGEEERASFWEFQQESCIMSSLDHPNIVKLLGVTASPPRMIMELLLGDLSQIIHPPDPQNPNIRIPGSSEKYSWRLRMRIAYDVALGMQYLQNIIPPVIHRDLRSPNIFLASLDEDAPICAKVADFGLSRVITSGISGSLNTWRWLAPEVILEDGGEYEISSDVYSFGIVLWELVSFGYPFDELLYNPRYSRKIVDGNGKQICMINPSDVKHGIIHEQLRPTIPKDCRNDIADLIRRCWHQNPKKRPKFDEIVYILSLELKIKLKDITFNRELFSRRDIEVNLPAILQSERRILASPRKFPATFSHVTKIENRYISCMEVIPLSYEVWAGTSDGLLMIIDSRDDNILDEIPAHQKRITSICLVGSSIWTSSGDGSIRVWNVITRECTHTTHANADNYTLKCTYNVIISKNESRVWISSPRTKTIYIFDPDTLAVLNELKVSSGVHSMIQIDNYVWLGTESGSIIIIHADTLDFKGNFSAGEKTIGCFASHRNCVFAGTDGGKFISFYFDPETMEVFYLSSSKTHFGSINSIDKNYNHIWTVSNDRFIILWDVETLKPVQELEKAHGDTILYLLRVNTYTVWTASTDGSLGVWKVSPPDVRMEKSKSRSNSVTGDKMRKGSVDKPFKPTKFMARNKKGALHPSKFEGSYRIELRTNVLPSRVCNPSRQRRGSGSKMKRMTDKIPSKFKKKA